MDDVIKITTTLEKRMRADRNNFVKWLERSAVNVKINENPTVQAMDKCLKEFEVFKASIQKDLIESQKRLIRKMLII